MLPKLKIDTRKWGWHEDGAENANGPYDTKDEAITNAIENLESIYPGKWITIMVGRCSVLDHVHEAGIVADCDTFLEEMEERAADEYLFYDGTFFNLANHQEAQEAWITMVKMWAKAYLTCSIWQLDDEKSETIYIPHDELEITCPDCHASGKSPTSDCCETCAGKGYIPSDPSRSATTEKMPTSGDDQ